MSIFTKIFNHKTKTDSPIFKCPHCGKDIIFEFDMKHSHTFETKIDTDNQLEKVFIKKVDEK